MKMRAEERWERMQELLAREAAGHDGPVKISSQRTLFGIKSHVEEVIERVAAEDEQRCFDSLNDAAKDTSAHADTNTDPKANGERSTDLEQNANATPNEDRDSGLNPRYI